MSTTLCPPAPTTVLRLSCGQEEGRPAAGVGSIDMVPLSVAACRRGTAHACRMLRTAHSCTAARSVAGKEQPLALQKRLSRPWCPFLPVGSITTQQAHQRLRQLDDVVRLLLARKVVGHKRSWLPADRFKPGVAAACGGRGRRGASAMRRPLQRRRRRRAARAAAASSGRTRPAGAAQMLCACPPTACLPTPAARSSPKATGISIWLLRDMGALWRSLMDCGDAERWQGVLFGRPQRARAWTGAVHAAATRTAVAAPLDV